MLKIDKLCVRYGKQTALDIDETIVFEGNDRIGIIGANGAGKSTFVKAVLGLIKYEGKIECDFKNTDIGVFMQFNNYVNTMPVKYIIETILNTKIEKNTELKKLIEFFEFTGCLNKKYRFLSGGQKQKLTIIMVLIKESPLVFFDEMTSGIDFEARQKLMSKVVEWYEKKNSTLCFVSHYYEEIEPVVNKILLIDKGKVIAYGSKEDLFNKYCGRTVITVENTKQNAEDLECFEKISSVENTIALKCPDEETENKIVGYLIKKDINFKRTNNDIEVLSVNAKEQYYKERSAVK